MAITVIKSSKLAASSALALFSWRSSDTGLLGFKHVFSDALGRLRRLWKWAKAVFGRGYGFISAYCLAKGQQ